MTSEKDRLPVHRGVLEPGELSDLATWTDWVEGWPPGSHVWGHYAEQTEAGPVICRTENLSACHRGFEGLVSGPLLEIASSHLGADVVDFKDKINYKHPGGAGFSPHQDLLAYPGASRVVSVLIAIDECTTTSGCIWMDPSVAGLVPTDNRGVIVANLSASLSWTPVELSPGDAVCIGGLAPHFSQANRGSQKRRVLVASYAPRDDLYTRHEYYLARRHKMGTPASEGRMRISTLADFDGTAIVDQLPASSASPSGSGACAHEQSHV